MRYSIEGGSLPAVIIQLDPGEVIISESGGRTWSRGPIVTEAKAEGGAGKAIGRLLTGESMFMSRYTAQGPAEIAFSSSFPGNMWPSPPTRQTCSPIIRWAAPIGCCRWRYRRSIMEVAG